jgi:hypothetical protein
MIFIQFLHEIMHHSCKLVGLGCGEKFLNRFVEITPVAFESQDVIAFLINNLLCMSR